MNGQIVRMIPAKGFGFVASDDGSGDVFLHCHSIVNRKWEEVYEGDRVEFEVVDSDRGLRAVHVRVI